MSLEPLLINTVEIKEINLIAGVNNENNELNQPGTPIVGC
jgi:hypothetical protein